MWSTSITSNCQPDAEFTGDEEVVVQDIDIRTDNVKFRKRNTTRQQKRTYLARIAAGTAANLDTSEKLGLGALVREWDERTPPKSWIFLQMGGLLMSAGQLSNMLIKDQDLFMTAAQVVQAGLASSPWQHLDSTGTRVNGINQHCHVLCNLLYTDYLHVAYQR